jgi:hypothetical protein
MDGLAFRGMNGRERGYQPMTLVKKSQPPDRPCIVCGKPAQDSICPTCQARIQGEAIEKKSEVEKKGRTDQGRQ